MALAATKIAMPWKCSQQGAVASKLT